MSKLYSCRPSNILGIRDEYTAFCFDEACALIYVKLQNGEKPRYKNFDNETEMQVEYTNFIDFYKDFEGQI